MWDESRIKRNRVEIRWKWCIVLMSRNKMDSSGKNAFHLFGLMRKESRKKFKKYNYYINKKLE